MSKKEKKIVEELEQEVTHLAHLWYEYVSKGYHKDCDCHWYIERRWSYSNEPKWYAWHSGYIFEGEEIEADSYEDALRKLLGLIKKAFKKEKEWAKRILEDPTNWDEDQIERAKWLKENITINPNL